MKKIRGGSGLGDSLYVRPIVDHFVRAGHKTTVMSNHPDVFIGSGATIKPFTRIGTNVLAHYTAGKKNSNTTMWQDVCKSAGVSPKFTIEWSIRNTELVESFKSQAAGRPIVIVVGGRRPMDRKDGFGMELLPSKEGFNSVLFSLKECFLVQVGKAEQIYELHSDLNLNGKTTISDLLDIASMCSGVVGQCSFAVPLSEIFNKPFLMVWSHKVSTAAQEFINVMTPKKVMSGANDRFVMDDWESDRVDVVLNEYRQLLAIR